MPCSRPPEARCTGHQSQNIGHSTSGFSEMQTSTRLTPPIHLASESGLCGETEQTTVRLGSGPSNTVTSVRLGRALICASPAFS